MAKVYTVTHYQELVNKQKYSSNPECFYKTRVYEHKTNFGTPLHDVQVRYSELDKNVSSEWYGKTVVGLVEDGNGVTVTLLDNKDDAEAREVRLNYCQMTELLLALTKWHQINGTGMMRETKIKR